MKYIFLILLLFPVSMNAQCTMHNAQSAPSASFVTVRGTHFYEGASTQPLYFKGANLWYAPILASAGMGGDLPRLHRELARLQQLGVTNLRIVANFERGSIHAPYVQPYTMSFEANEKLGVRSEECAQHNAQSASAHSSLLTPHSSLTIWNDTLLIGLDRLLSILPQYNMRAVLCLTNAWDWSGGLGHYLERTGHGPSPAATGDGWGAYCEHIAQFYTDTLAIRYYHEAVRHIVARTNTITHRPYAADPSIFAWQLCNEPRPFARHTEDAFIHWADTTSRLIRSLDPNHLISTGSEGIIGCNVSADLCLRLHALPCISYITAHIWPVNWRWASADRLFDALPNVYLKTDEYLREHLHLAHRLQRPLVVEEFGYPRDATRYTPTSPTRARNAYYDYLFSHLAASAAAQQPLAGLNFWGWGGEGRPADKSEELEVRNEECEKNNAQSAPAHSSLLTPHSSLSQHLIIDPPHEPQGWYSVYDTDSLTLRIIRDSKLN